MKHYMSAFLLSAFLLVSVAAVKGDDDHHRYEDRAYRAYLREQHYEYRSLGRQRRERQVEYWRWRHQHPHVVVEVR
jgi:hypothetical protein